MAGDHKIMVHDIVWSVWKHTAAGNAAGVL